MDDAMKWDRDALLNEFREQHQQLVNAQKKVAHLEHVLADRIERNADRYSAAVDEVVEILCAENVEKLQRDAIATEFIKAEPFGW
jgi:ABC-type ATPase with predicted acetyltransferase domain